MEPVKTLDATEYQNAINRLVKSKTSAVVLGEDTFVISPDGVVSVPGTNVMTPQQFSKFKAWLTIQTGETK